VQKAVFDNLRSGSSQEDVRTRAPGMTILNRLRSGCSGEIHFMVRIEIPPAGHACWHVVEFTAPWILLLRPVAIWVKYRLSP
jgi:hypothetical protein